MLGYAIAALKNESKVVGLRILNVESMKMKDLPLNSCLLLFKKSAIKNLLSFDLKEIQELPLLDVNTGRLDKDIYTVLLKGFGEQYLVCNAKGNFYKIDGLEARKLVYTNADKDMVPLSGGYILTDSTDENYDRLMALDMVSLNIEDGVAKVIKEADSIVFPSFVTQIAKDCWEITNKIFEVVLSPNIVELNQGDFEDLRAERLVIPYGVKQMNPLAFSGSNIDKVYILGNTKVVKGAFINSNIKEVYVSKGLKNLYMVAVTGTRTKVKDLDMSKM